MKSWYILPTLYGKSGKKCLEKPRVSNTRIYNKRKMYKTSASSNKRESVCCVNWIASSVEGINCVTAFSWKQLCWFPGWSAGKKKKKIQILSSHWFRCVTATSAIEMSKFRLKVDKNSYNSLCYFQSNTFNSNLSNFKAIRPYTALYYPTGYTW